MITEEDLEDVPTFDIIQELVRRNAYLMIKPDGEWAYLDDKLREESRDEECE